MDNTSVTEQNITDYMIDLTKYVPDFIYNCPPTKQIFEAQERQLAILNYYIQDIINNCFISSSTWSLDIWEREYGIKTDSSLTFESRRQTLLAKKKGYVATTEAMIKSIAEVYDCDCEVIPHYDEYYFIIKFTGIGIPSNLDAFKEIIEQFKPAHLGVEYQFTYETWGEVGEFTYWDAKHYTWEQILNEPLNHYKSIDTNSFVGLAIVGQAVVGNDDCQDLNDAVVGEALVGYSKIGKQ